MAADGQPVILTQLGGDEISLTLEGVTLPEQGIEVGVKQRKTRSWLPGSSRPVTQVHGPEEEPITLTGYVRDEMAGEGAALDIDAKLRRMTKDGYTVRLEYGDQWAKEGLLETYRPTIYADGYLRYRIEFGVHESTDAEAPGKVKPVPEPDVDSLTAAAKAASLAVMTLSRSPFPASI